MRRPRLLVDAKSEAITALRGRPPPTPTPMINVKHLYDENTNNIHLRTRSGKRLSECGCENDHKLYPI
jgi:hypothetical protein